MPLFMFSEVIHIHLTKLCHTTTITWTVHAVNSTAINNRNKLWQDNTACQRLLQKLQQSNCGKNEVPRGVQLLLLLSSRVLELVSSAGNFALNVNSFYWNLVRCIVWYSLSRAVSDERSITISRILLVISGVSVVLFWKDTQYKVRWECWWRMVSYMARFPCGVPTIWNCLQE